MLCIAELENANLQIFRNLGGKFTKVMYSHDENAYFLIVTTVLLTVYDTDLFPGG